MKVYTKTGDSGETSLLGGSRVLKSDIRIAAYGEADEVNSKLGLLISKMEPYSELAEQVDFLFKIQSDLFILGSNLASPKEQRLKFDLDQFKEEDILSIESQIDKMELGLGPLKNFILPGGSEAAAIAHIVRTDTRHLERTLVFLNKEIPNELPQFSLEYINRLSDYFFVLARFINKKLKYKEKLWQG